MARFGHSLVLWAFTSAVLAADEACSAPGTCSAGGAPKENLLLQTAASANVHMMAPTLTTDKSESLAPPSPDAVPPKLPRPYLRVPPAAALAEAPQAIHLDQEHTNFQPTADERANLDLVNALRRQGFTCGADASEGYATSQYFPPNNNPPLVWDCRLYQAERKYVARMANENFFCHDCQGSTPCTRTNAEGFPNNQGCGENIAAGRQAQSDALEQWKASAGHCRNLMEPGYKQLAVAYAYSASSTYRYYWGQSFGSTIKGVDQSCIGGPPAPSPAPGCADTDTEANCATYKAQNLCSSANVRAACKDTCNVCGSPSPSPSPQPSPSPGCQDTDSNCAYYAQRGYCDTSPNVKTACKVTCGLCGSPQPQPSPPQPQPSPPGQSCRDTDSNCQYYSAHGYCDTSPNVKGACRATCNLC